VTKVEIATGDEKAPRRSLPENATLTVPRPRDEIVRAISQVVARADEDFAREMVTVLQVRARLASDTGERLTLAEFADQEGFDLAQLRAE